MRNSFEGVECVKWAVTTELRKKIISAFHRSVAEKDEKYIRLESDTLKGKLCNVFFRIEKNISNTSSFTFQRDHAYTYRLICIYVIYFEKD